MKIYWTTPNAPELATFSPIERKQIWRECSRSTPSFVRAAIAGVSAGCGALVGDLIGPGCGIWGAGIGGGIGGFIAGQFMVNRTLAVIRELYRPDVPSTTFLNERNHKETNGEQAAASDGDKPPN
ncbi:hypothetical protein HNR46_003612 [Haloferula luteola]|uniref:Uncharacterized protein n=1 Tax=Haloferula luteola TaxID=595692 RepID=A0A840V8H8_9BACT|nr:hypothetical protein [Haloferula luteola]MBB5353356.1 hypothetical protein [Haloferula luteola]